MYILVLVEGGTRLGSGIGGTGGFLESTRCLFAFSGSFYSPKLAQLEVLLQQKICVMLLLLKLSTRLLSTYLSITVLYYVSLSIPKRCPVPTSVLS